MPHTRGKSKRVCNDSAAKSCVVISFTPFVGLAQRIETASSGPSPSEVLKAAETVNKFLGDDSLVYLNRVPAQIFSPPLAQLQQYLETLENMDVSHTTIAHAYNLLAHLVQFYEDEDALAVQITGDISALLDGDEWYKQIGPATKIRPYASWFYKSYPIGLLELKNTLGIGGDTMYQVIVDYTKVIATEEVCTTSNLLSCSEC